MRSKIQCDGESWKILQNEVEPNGTLAPLLTACFFIVSLPAMVTSPHDVDSNHNLLFICNQTLITCYSNLGLHFQTGYSTMPFW